MPTEVAPGIWYHPRSEIGILKGVHLTMGAPQEIGRQHYSTGQELGRADLAEWCREIDTYHREHNGWLGFGYSFAVGRDVDPAKAHIFEGRGWGAVGAHTMNHNNDLGVVFLGNDDPGVNDTTPGVRAALRLLFTTRTGGVIGSSPRALREVHGHRETYSTDCPGDELETWVKAGLPVPVVPKPTPAPPHPVRPSGGLRYRKVTVAVVLAAKLRRVDVLTYIGRQVGRTRAELLAINVSAPWRHRNLRLGDQILVRTG